MAPSKGIIYRAKAPLRLGLAGGGTDVSPYAEKFGGLVLNVTIDKFTYASIMPREDGLIKLISVDGAVSWSNHELVKLDDIPKELKLHAGVYLGITRRFSNKKKLAIEISTFSEVPTGSGLGSSSAIVVALIKVFCEYLNLPLGEYDIAQLAWEIERKDLGLAGGKQDQYSAAFGGMNLMEFHEKAVVVNPLNLKLEILQELESSLLLFYTGDSRESGKIIEEQSHNVTQEIEEPLMALHQVKSEAIRMKQALIRGDFELLIDSMRAGWNSKKKMAKSITNSYIEQIYLTAINAGALAGRVSGAGGGGFMIFFVDLLYRKEVMNALSVYDGSFFSCNFYWEGASSWKKET